MRTITRDQYLSNLTKNHYLLEITIYPSEFTTYQITIHLSDKSMILVVIIDISRYLNIIKFNIQLILTYSLINGVTI